MDEGKGGREWGRWERTAGPNVSILRFVVPFCSFCEDSALSKKKLCEKSEKKNPIPQKNENY